MFVIKIVSDNTAQLKAKLAGFCFVLTTVHTKKNYLFKKYCRYASTEMFTALEAAALTAVHHLGLSAVSKNVKNLDLSVHVPVFYVQNDQNMHPDAFFCLHYRSV